MIMFGYDIWWLVVVKVIVVFVFFMLMVLVVILVECKLLGWMQLWFGFNWVGLKGVLQSLVDGIKLVFKESIIFGGID